MPLELSYGLCQRKFDLYELKLSIIVNYIYIRTYISRDYGLTSYTTHVVCVNFILYMSGGTYSLTSTLNDRFLRNFFMAGLFTLGVFARNLLRRNQPREYFVSIFRFDA